MTTPSRGIGDSIDPRAGDEPAEVSDRFSEFCNPDFDDRDRRRLDFRRISGDFRPNWSVNFFTQFSGLMGRGLV